MNYLVLLRHGQSRWNLANKFTGWVDVPLSASGVRHAMETAEKLKKWKMDIAFTSELTRAQETLLILLSHQDRTGIFLHEGREKEKWTVHSNQLNFDDLPIYATYLLNERYYGELQGMDKIEAKTKYGEKQVFKWRRGYYDRPPEGESLKDVYERVVPYFEESIMKEMKKGKNVLVSAHGNSLRAIIKHIEGVSDKEIAYLELPTAEPIIYGFFRDELIKEEKPFSFNRPLYWHSG